MTTLLVHDGSTVQTGPAQLEGVSPGYGNLATPEIALVVASSPGRSQDGSSCTVFLWEVLNDQDVSAEMNDSVLLTSEVASNAARHGAEPIEVSVTVDDDGCGSRCSMRGRGSMRRHEIRRRGPTLRRWLLSHVVGRLPLPL